VIGRGRGGGEDGDETYGSYTSDEERVDARESTADNIDLDSLATTCCMLC
jgi:hypothetical protein